MHKFIFPYSLIIVGGRSRTAEALRNRYVIEKLTGIVRGEAGAGEVSVNSYADTPPKIDMADSVVVHCAGKVTGTAEQLYEANVTSARVWAKAAKNGGARKFISISSFSIFGNATAIDGQTHGAPVSDYGCSKFAAEQAIADFAGAGMMVSFLRVPILVGSGTDKLARLIHSAKAIRLIPAAPWPCPRSMLSYDGLARAIELTASQSGAADLEKLFAADPKPFAVEDLIATMQHNDIASRKVVLPEPVLKLCRIIRPQVFASLFQPSILQADSNILAKYDDYDRLHDIMTLELMSAEQSK